MTADYVRVPARCSQMYTIDYTVMHSNVIKSVFTNPLFLLHLFHFCLPADPYLFDTFLLV